MALKKGRVVLIENFDDKLVDLVMEILTFKQSYIIEKIYKK